MGRARDNGNQHHKINAETEAEYIEPLLLNHVAAAGPYHMRRPLMRSFFECASRGTQHRRHHAACCLPIKNSRIYAHRLSCMREFWCCARASASLSASATARGRTCVPQCLDARVHMAACLTKQRRATTSSSSTTTITTTTTTTTTTKITTTTITTTTTTTTTTTAQRTRLRA